MKKAPIKKVEKYVTEKTFEKSMLSIAKSFSRVEGALEIVIKEVRNLHEDNKYMRQTLTSVDSTVSIHDRKIDNLTMRVEKLELKVK